MTLVQVEETDAHVLLLLPHCHVVPAAAAGEGAILNPLQPLSDWPGDGEGACPTAERVSAERASAA